MPRRAMQKMLDLSMHSVSMYRKSLNEKGWISGDIPAPMIVKLQKQFAESDSISFTVKIDVDVKGGKQIAGQAGRDTRADGNKDHTEHMVRG